MTDQTEDIHRVIVADSNITACGRAFGMHEGQPTLKTTLKDEEVTCPECKKAMAELDQTDNRFKGEVVKLVSVQESHLAALLDRLKEYESNEDKIATCCQKALQVFGLADKETGEVVPELQKGEGVMGIIMNALTEQISISDMMFNKKRFEEEMNEKFGFFKDLMPIFQSYAERKRQQKQQLQSGNTAGA